MTAPRPPRAPIEDGAVVAVPELSKAGDLALGNYHRLAHSKTRLLHQDLANARAEARAVLLKDAQTYHESCDESLPALNSGPLFMAGHQPELFHPGVWLKNFALARLAARHKGIAVNLIVDYDSPRSLSARLPTPAPDVNGVPHLHTIALDRWTPDVPYEELAIADPALFASFGLRASELLKGWNYEPFLGNYWKSVLDPTHATPLVGERLARARRRWERAWGCHNLEIPVSRLCRTRAFALFFCHLALHGSRFHEIYNGCVRAYRRAQGLRSRNHPVPDLAINGSWLEMPFWGWRSARPRRGRLQILLEKDALHLRVGEENWPSIPVRPEKNYVATFVALGELEKAGYKIRPRALTNTLFARLLLCDLFVHGIGGGKYDELTDAIIREFFDLEPPEFTILSGTLYLPLPRYAATRQQEIDLMQLNRDLYFNPDRHLEPDMVHTSLISELVDRKKSWILGPLVSESSWKKKYEEIRLVNSRLRAWVEDEHHSCRVRLEEVRRQLAANAVVARRDYAFCFHSEAKLRQFFHHGEELKIGN